MTDSDSNRIKQMYLGYAKSDIKRYKNFRLLKFLFIGKNWLSEKNHVNLKHVPIEKKMPEIHEN